MAQKSAGGRFIGRVTDEFTRLTGSVAAYINKPLDPHVSAVEVLCFLVGAAAEIWAITQLSLAPAVARFRLVATPPPETAWAITMGGAFAVYFALTFLLELPMGARVAGALMATVAAGAAVAVVPLLAPASPVATPAAMVLAAAVVLQVRCRKSFVTALALSAGSLVAMVVLRQVLSGS